MPAENYNAFIEAATWVREQQRRPGGSSGRGAPQAALLVTVKNDTASQMNRFAAVGVSGIVTDPSAAPDEFKNRIAIKARVPTSADSNRWLVLPQPLPAGQYGLAVALGVTPCWIDLGAVGDLAVDVADGSGIPVSGASGAGRILWVAGGAGTATATGAQWALIHLGGGAGGDILRGTVTKDGGAGGDETTQATWTYTLKDKSGKTLSTGLSPEWVRPVGAMKFAPDGSTAPYYIDDSGNPTLMTVNEVEDTDTCSTGA